jgi:hypothetical protein
VDLGDARRSLSVEIPQGLHQSEPDQASRADGEAIRTLLETWVGPEYVETDWLDEP